MHRRSAGVLLKHWRRLYRDGAVAPEVRAEAGQALTRAQRMLSQRARSAGAYGSFYRFEAELIEAALDPEETNLIFFVADGTGGHAFAETLEEHNANVAKWREIERQRNSD